MKIVLSRRPDETEDYLLKAYNLLARRKVLSLNLASALKAIGPATSTNTPEEAGSILEQMAELGIIDIEYSA